MKSTKIKMYELLLETVFEKLKSKIETLKLKTLFLSESLSCMSLNFEGIGEPVTFHLALKYKGEDDEIIDMNLILSTPHRDITKKHRFHCTNVMGISDIEYITGEIVDMIYFE